MLILDVLALFALAQRSAKGAALIALAIFLFAAGLLAVAAPGVLDGDGGGDAGIKERLVLRDETKGLRNRGCG